jgi:L-rhamnose mutarotase
VKVALHTRLRPDRIAEYEQAHEAVPEQLTEAIRAAGVSAWTIWRSGTDLFHLIDCAEYAAALAYLDQHPVNAAWQGRWRSCSRPSMTTPRMARPPRCRSCGAFGPGRIMFGSDWPVCLLASDYAGVVDLAQALVAGLSGAERAAVFASTAARVYGIDGPARVGGGDQVRGGGSWR